MLSGTKRVVGQGDERETDRLRAAILSAGAWAGRFCPFRPNENSIGADKTRRSRSATADGRRFSSGFARLVDITSFPLFCPGSVDETFELCGRWGAKLGEWRELDAGCWLLDAGGDGRRGGLLRRWYWQPLAAGTRLMLLGFVTGDRPLPPYSILYRCEPSRLGGQFQQLFLATSVRDGAYPNNCESSTPSARDPPMMMQWP